MRIREIFIVQSKGLMRNMEGGIKSGDGHFATSMNAMIERKSDEGRKNRRRIQSGK